jgi:hypothetical protein
MKKKIFSNLQQRQGQCGNKGETIQFWYKHFAVLSGSYLLFFNEDIENADTYDSSFYLKDAVIEESYDKELDNTFFIINESNEVHVYLSDEESMKDWVKMIRERIYEINNLVEFDEHEK